MSINTNNNHYVHGQYISTNIEQASPEVLAWFNEHVFSKDHIPKENRAPLISYLEVLGKSKDMQIAKYEEIPEEHDENSNNNNNPRKHKTLMRVRRLFQKKINKKSTPQIEDDKEVRQTNNNNEESNNNNNEKPEVRTILYYLENDSD